MPSPTHEVVVVLFYQEILLVDYLLIMGAASAGLACPCCFVLCIVQLMLVWALAAMVAVAGASKEAAPGLSKETYRYSIVEEVAAGTFVGNIFADSRIEEKYRPSELSGLRFRFLAAPPLEFTVEERTGLVATGGRLDRDQICPGLAKCHVRLDIVAMVSNPVEIRELIKVYVDIEDINDNSPRFPESLVSHHILESAVPGTSVLIPTAVDPDSGQFGVRGYRLIPQSGKFKLQVTKGPDGSQEVRLVVQKQLDRERKMRYRMAVVAFDGGSPAKSGTVDVVVRVQDANDNDPVFDNLTYVVAIPENIPIQSTIVTVRARDRDAGLYGKVRYKFSDRTQDIYGDLFGIKNNTGEIFVRGVIDYEKSKMYHLSVIAQDRAPEALQADTTVIVTVQDVNDHSPAITVNTLLATGTDEAEVVENAPPGTFVAHLSVVDQDSGLNGNFSCFMNHPDFRLENMNHGEYKIVTRTMLDREARSEYILPVTCRDKGTEPQVSIKHIKILVGDVNDNTPYFTRETYEATLQENNFNGATVLRVNATDRDVGKNGEIWYTLEEEITETFRVDPFSGTIMAHVVFDHEVRDKYVFNVLTLDGGIPPRSSSAIVTVRIGDENDESPQFAHKQYTFYVSENERPDVTVGHVTASDIDSPPLNTFRFSLGQIEPETAAGYFKIGPQTGEIVAVSSLDRETTPVIYLEVVATDAGDPPQSSSVTATVTVTDQNDNAPAFVYPSSRNNTIYVSNQLPLGHVIARITARDPDQDANGTLTYHVMSGNDEGLFKLNSSTGVATVDASLSEFEYKSIDLTLLAKDQGSPGKSTTIHWYVVVNKAASHVSGGDDVLSHYRMYIIIAVACFLGASLVIVLVAIVLVCRKRKRRKKKKEKHKCQGETLQMLQSQESTLDGPLSSPCKHEAQANCISATHPDKPKKEVSFNLDFEDVPAHKLEIVVPKPRPKSIMVPTPPPPPTQILPLPKSPKQGRAPPLGHVTHHASPGPSWALTQRELEVHQLPQMVKRDQDADSAYSGESSNTDSGRGLSEEGDPSLRLLQEGPGSGTSHAMGGNAAHSFVPDDSISLPPSENAPKHSYSSLPAKLHTFSAPMGPPGMTTLHGGAKSRYLGTRGGGHHTLPLRGMEQPRKLFSQGSDSGVGTCERPVHNDSLEDNKTSEHSFKSFSSESVKSFSPTVSQNSPKSSSQSASPSPHKQMLGGTFSKARSTSKDTVV